MNEERRKWPRALAMIIVFLVGALIGWLLALRHPECPRPGGGDGSVIGESTGSRGTGTPSKVGTGSGNATSEGGSSTATGNVRSGGTGGEGSGTGADAGGGGRGGGATQGGSGDERKSPDTDQRLGAAVVRLAAGQSLLSGPVDAASAPPDVASKVLSAPDFTYDKTGLPRYPQAVQRVASALSYPDPNDPDNYGTSAAIVTNDSFDTVVGWYQSHLPAGWRSQSIGDLGRLAQQLSPQNLTKMLSGRSDAAGSSDPTMSAAGDRIQISVFSPPAGLQGTPGVMVVKKGDEPVMAMLKSQVTATK